MTTRLLKIIIHNDFLKHYVYIYKCTYDVFYVHGLGGCLRTIVLTRKLFSTRVKCGSFKVLLKTYLRMYQAYVTIQLGEEVKVWPFWSLI